ncbi:MAG: CDC27 family protein [Bacteroidia bacterium]
MLKNHWFFAIVGVCLLQNVAVAQIAKVKELIKGEYFKEAKQEALALTSKDPANPENFYWSGMASYGMEKYEDAKVEFQKGIKAKGKFALNHTGMGRVLQQEGKQKEADAMFAKALELSKSEDVPVLLSVAEGRLEAADKLPGYKNMEARMKQLKEAEVLALKAQGKAPNNLESYVVLGDMYLKKNVPMLAQNQYMQAVTKDAKYVDGYLRLARIKIKEGDAFMEKDKISDADKVYKEGIEYLTKAVTADPNFAPAYRDRSELYYSYRQYPEALKDCQKYLELTKNDLKAKVQYAKLLFLTKDYTKCIETITAIKDTSTSALRRLLAFSYYYTDKIPEARTAIDDYMAQSKPEYRITDDYIISGKVWKRMDSLKQTAAAFEDALKMDSTKYGLYDTLIWAYRAKKDYANEAVYREKQILRKPTEKVSYADYGNLGITHFLSKNYPSAEKALNQSISMDPTFETGAYYLARTMNIQETGKDSVYKYGHAAPAYEQLAKIIETKKEKKELKEDETTHLLMAYKYLINFTLDPEKDGKDIKCDAAKPIIEKYSKAVPADDKWAVYYKDKCAAPAPEPTPESTPTGTGTTPTPENK